MEENIYLKTNKIYMYLMMIELQYLLTSSGRRDHYLNTMFTNIQDIVHIWVQGRPRNNHPKKTWQIKNKVH